MLLLDPRVGSKHLAPIFDAMKVEYEVTPLTFGDCAFLGNGPDGPVKVGIEVKGGTGGADFIQSMQSNRLVGHQVEGLVPAYDRRYLIVEGLRPRHDGIIWQASRGKGKKFRPIFMVDIEKFLTGIEENGIRVRRTASPEETAIVIVKQLYAFWQKDYDAHTSIAANVLYEQPFFSLRAEDPATSRIRRTAVALKAGIGVGRSKAVAATFGSVLAMATADVGAWESIEGVGKTIARGVHQAIRETAATHQVHRVRHAARGVSKRCRPAARSVRHPGRR